MEAVTARLEEFSARLSREPDFAAAELQAHDAADILLLQTAADRVARSAPGSVVTIGDRHGALSLGAVGVLGATGVRVHQDPLLSERALHRNAERLGLSQHLSSHPLGEALLAGATTVLVQLPRGLEALDELAWHIARYAAPGVRVFAGGRVKHMTRAQNDVLARYFGEVQAGLGWRKSRVLQAASPRPVNELGAPPFPKWGTDADLKFSLAAFGATFGGAKLDHGSRLLLSTFGPDRGPDAWSGLPAEPRVFDLGCGNGVLAVSAALALPDAQVIASDQSAAAVSSTLLTAERAGVADRVSVHRADGAEAVERGWADLVLLNPPFHTGATVHAGVAHRLIRDCARILKPGGELRVVFNSHLGYRPILQDAIGQTRQLARDATFTVLAATR